MYTAWKGWGPKGLVFTRVGGTWPDLKRPTTGVSCVMEFVRVRSSVTLVLAIWACTGLKLF